LAVKETEKSMSHLSERELVHAPLGSADRLLSAFMEANPAPAAAGARVILRAAEFAEPAIVSLTPAHRPADMTPRYAVHWQAEGGGAFPIFDGFLSVAADEDYNSYWLVIEGDYEPPGGLAGKMFDAVIGNRIAVATTRNLLASLRETAEALFTKEEARKPH
jgi:hypothetical protein